MQINSGFTLLIALLVTFVTASQKVGVSSALGYSCWNCANRWDFGCTDANLATCKCRNINYLGTVLACISQHGQNEKEMDRGLTYVQQYCRYYGNKLYTKKEIGDVYYKSKQLLIQGNSITDSLGKVYAPVLVNEPEFYAQFKIASEARFQYTLANILGCILLGYWGVVVGIGSVVHLFKCKFPSKLAAMTPGWVDTLRKSLILPATFKGSHSRPIKFAGMSISIPTRGEFIIMTGYVLLNIGLLAAIWQYETDEQLLRYLGNRSGIMAFTQLPIMIGFACRNNPLIYLTGWSYSVFQVYHHCIGRMVILLGFVHAVCFTWLAYLTKSMAFRWRFIINWRYGNASMLVGLVMVAFTYRGVRIRWYELFATLHKLFYIAFTLTLCFHCLDFGWMPWVYTSLGIYIADRLVRIGWVLRSGLGRASFEAVDQHSIRVTILYSDNWKPFAGSFVYLRILTGRLFWQAHPFSVFSGRHGNLELVIKIKDGATSEYMKMAEQRATCRVLLEGPYGTPAPLASYQTAVLLAGGVGVTTMYSYALELMKHNHRVLFIWVIPDTDPVHWFGPELMPITEHENAELEIFVTKAMFKKQEGEVQCGSSIAIVDNNQIPKHSQIERRYAPFLYNERPNIFNETKRYINSSDGRVAICSCGPPSFLDAIRKSVSVHIHESQSRVDYFEEAFSW